MHGNDKYTPAQGQKIAELLASNHNLADIAALEGFPAVNTIRQWMYRHEDFSHLCARARLAQADILADEIAETIKDVKNCKLAPDQARVMLGSMQWLASKKNPKIYGDRQILAGDAENPLQLLAVRLDEAIANSSRMIDVTPRDDGSDLV